MAKPKRKSKGGGLATIDGSNTDYSTGTTWKTPISHQPYAEVGDLDPAKLRAMNIKAGNMTQQLEWAEEYLLAVEEYEDGRKDIEKIRSQIEKKYFQTEKQIDEYVLASLLAKEGYQEHFREWEARKALELGLIKQVANEEIRAIADEFALKTQEWKVATDVRIANFKAASDARIAQTSAGKDNSQALQKALAKQKLKLFTSGAPMDEVNAVGKASEATISVVATGGRGSETKSLLDVFSFKF